MKRGYWADKIDEVVDLIRNDKTVEEMAELYEVSTVAIRKVIAGYGLSVREIKAEAGIPLTSKATWFYEKDNLIRYARQGKTQAEIAEIYNTNSARIGSALTRNGIRLLFERHHNSL